MSRKRHPKGRGCWYYTEQHECPICGRGGTYRERRWGRKPKDPARRWRYVVMYDYCDVL